MARTNKLNKLPNEKISTPTRTKQTKLFFSKPRFLKVGYLETPINSNFLLLYSLMETITALRCGDKKVFKLVFDQYQRKIYGYILKRSRSEYLAEEVVQITFIKLWNYRERLKENLSLQTQLFRISSTTLIDLLRKQLTSISLIKELSQITSSNSDEIQHTLNAKELQEKLVHAIMEMPRLRRKVFEMSRFDGMSCSEIAENLSISTRTVETHISRAIKQLRQNLPVFVNIVWMIVCCR